MGDIRTIQRAARIANRSQLPLLVKLPRFVERRRPHSSRHPAITCDTEFTRRLERLARRQWINHCFADSSGTVKHWRAILPTTVRVTQIEDGIVIDEDAKHAESRKRRRTGVRQAWNGLFPEMVIPASAPVIVGLTDWTERSTVTGWVADVTEMLSDHPDARLILPGDYGDFASARDVRMQRHRRSVADETWHQIVAHDMRERIFMPGVFDNQHDLVAGADRLWLSDDFEPHRWAQLASLWRVRSTSSFSAAKLNPVDFSKTIDACVGALVGQRCFASPD